MTDTKLTEVEMRRALGLDSVPQKQPMPKLSSTFTLVELSVDEKGDWTKKVIYLLMTDRPLLAACCLSRIAGLDRLRPLVTGS